MLEKLNAKKFFQKVANKVRALSFRPAYAMAAAA